VRLTAVVTGLARDERAVAERLRELSARHPDDQEIHLLPLDLAEWSDLHADELAPWCDGVPPSPASAVDPEPAKDADPGLALLADLRAVHAQVRDVVLAWELVGVTAQALHDDRLLEVQQRAHEHALRQVRWLVTAAKQAAPQTLVT
jgi:hypothetical protein